MRLGRPAAFARRWTIPVDRPRRGLRLRCDRRELIRRFGGILAGRPGSDGATGFDGLLRSPGPGAAGGDGSGVPLVVIDGPRATISRWVAGDGAPAFVRRHAARRRSRT